MNAQVRQDFLDALKDREMKCSFDVSSARNAQGDLQMILARVHHAGVFLRKYRGRICTDGCRGPPKYELVYNMRLRGELLQSDVGNRWSDFDAILLKIEQVLAPHGGIASIVQRKGVFDEYRRFM